MSELVTDSRKHKIKYCRGPDTCCKNKILDKNTILKQEIEEDFQKIQELYCSIHKNEFDVPLSSMISYEPVVDCAEKIVDLTILLAKSFLTGINPEHQPEFEKVKPKQTIWPRTGELNMISGLKAIHEYLISMQCDSSLKFCVDFVKQISNQLTSTYVYEVKWSIPTKEEPVQISTANMYFSLQAYYAHHIASPIEVTYSYENSNLVLRPGDTKFKENWLLNIMESKTEFRQRHGLQLETFI